MLKSLIKLTLVLFLGFIFWLLLFEFIRAECLAFFFDSKVLYEVIEKSLEFMYPDGSFKPLYYSQQEIDAWIGFNRKILKAMEWNLKKHPDLFLQKELKILYAARNWLEAITDSEKPQEVKNILQWSSYHSPKARKLYQDVYYIYMGG